MTAPPPSSHPRSLPTSLPVDDPPRFRGVTATTRAQNVLAAGILAVIALSGAAGIFERSLLFFAAGAGAGYSLSGSV